MDDERILDLYWQRSERAVAETDARYGGLLRSIAQNILRDAADAEECGRGRRFRRSGRTRWQRIWRESRAI